MISKFSLYFACYAFYPNEQAVNVGRDRCNKWWCLDPPVLYDQQIAANFNTGSKVAFEKTAGLPFEKSVDFTGYSEITEKTCGIAKHRNSALKTVFTLMSLVTLSALVRCSSGEMLDRDEFQVQSFEPSTVELRKSLDDVLQFT